MAQKPEVLELRRTVEFVDRACSDNWVTLTSEY